MKTRTYWWCSVLGSPPEPCSLDTEDGVRTAYTAGCADGFAVDDEDCPLHLLAGISAPFNVLKSMSDNTQAPAAKQRVGRTQYPALGGHGWKPPLSDGSEATTNGDSGMKNQ